MTKDEALAQPQRKVQEWMKPHPKCDSACLFQCTKGFTQFPECAAQSQQEPVARISVQDALPKVVRDVSYNARLTDEWCDHSWSYEGHSHNDSFYVCTHCKKEEWR